MAQSKKMGILTRERLTEGDLQSLHQDVRTLNNLAYKYFAYLVML